MDGAKDMHDARPATLHLLLRTGLTVNAPSSRSFAGRILVATAAVAAGSAVLLTAACATGQASAGSQPPTSAAPAISSSPSPPPASAVVGSVAGLPGWLYYEDANARVLRLTTSGVDTVVSNDGWSANVPPGGASIKTLI